MRSLAQFIYKQQSTKEKKELTHPFVALIFERIELMTSIQAHFEEQTQPSKMSLSWGNRFPRWTLLLRIKAFPLCFCRLPTLPAGG